MTKDTRPDNFDADAALQAEDYWRQRADAAEKDNARLRDELQTIKIIVERNREKASLSESVDWSHWLDRIVARARGALSDTDDASPWRPIATAPTDGTKVLVSDGRSVWTSTRRLNEHADKSHPAFGPGNGHDWFVPEGYGYPKSWMPLPDPPKEGRI